MGAAAEVRVDISASIAKFSKAMNSASRKMTDIGNKAKRLGTDISKLSLPLAGAGLAALKFSTDFNNAMASVGTLIPGQTDKLKAFKKEVQDLSIETGKGTRDLAEGLFQVISTFGEGPETMKQLRIASRAAVAGLSETKEAINLIGIVTKNYGDTSATSQQKVADLAFVTNKLGVTTFPELAASMGEVAPVAASLNVSTEELFATYSALTGVTGNTAKVSTQLKAAFNALKAPGPELTKILKELGFKSGEALVKKKGLAKAIKLVVEKAKEMDIPLKKAFGSVEAIAAVEALATTQSEKFSKALEANKNSAGAADQAFREQSEGIDILGFEYNQLKQQAIILAQRLGDALTPAIKELRGVFDWLSEKLEAVVFWFEELDLDTQTMIIQFGGLIAIFGPLLLALGFVITTVASMAAKFIGFAAFLSKVFIGAMIYLADILIWIAGSGVIGLVIAAVGLLVAAFFIWRDEAVAIFDYILDRFNTFADNFTRGVKVLGSTLKNFLIDPLNGLGGAYDQAVIDVGRSHQTQTPNSITSTFGNSSISNALHGSTRGFAKGGIVRAPSLFQEARGLSKIAELGPEAVMPLKRMSNGNLGVQVSGSSGGSSTVINVDARGAQIGVAKQIRNELENLMDKNNSFPGRR